VVEGFYKALASADFDALAPYLADDVVWTISGPVDVLPFCGPRHGKDLVLKLLERDIPVFLEKRRQAQFVRFENEKVVEYVSIIDSFERGRAGAPPATHATRRRARRQRRGCRHLAHGACPAVTVTSTFMSRKSAAVPV
jgi:hypothetical protein